MMKVVIGLAALFMLSSLGVGAMLSHGPEIRSVSWTTGGSNSQEGWGQQVRLTDAPLPSDQAAVVRDAAGDIHMAWTDFRTGEPDVYYKKLDAAGHALIDDRRVSTSVSQSVYPAIATGPDGSVHIAWLDDRGGVWNVFYSRLDSAGTALVSNLQISNIQPGAVDASGFQQLPGLKRHSGLESYLAVEGRRPSIDVDGSGNAHLAWCDDRDGKGDVRYTVVGPGGSILTDQAKISYSSMDSHNAVVRVRGGEAIMVWAAASGDGGGIFYSSMDGSGNYIVNPVEVLTEPSAGIELDAAVDADGIARIAWSTDRGVNYDIYYASVDALGGLAGSVTKVSNTMLDSTHPSIKVDSTGAVHLAWMTEPDGLGRFSLSGIYYARLRADGNPIEAPGRITPSQYRSAGPVVVLSLDGVPAVFWSDSQDGAANSDLYMKSQVTVMVDAQQVETAVRAVPGSNYMPAAAAIGSVGMLLAVALTEAGRFKLTMMVIPLYSRLRKESLLNHSVREAIFGYVTDHPGANFSQIMRELDLKNGVLAYHLTTLEREDLIKSMRDGTFRRYYPRSSRDVPFEVQKAILERIERDPGITEGALAEGMGLSRQVLDYHLMSLIESGHVRFERRGKRNLAFVTQVAA